MNGLIYKDEAYKIIGACFDVHKSLGCGFLESVYQEALAIELSNRNIPFIKEFKIELFYKTHKLDKYFIADFICFDDIILELKAEDTISLKHEAQVLNYLKATQKSLGLLINFGEINLIYKRFVNAKDQH